MSEYEFKDQLENKSYAELLEMENVLANKILVQSVLGTGSSITNTKITGELEVVAGVLKSANYVAGTSGWQLTPTSGELNFAVSVDSLDIPDLITANSFHVDVDGNAWWGATTLAGALAAVLKTGVASFKSITLDTNVIIKDMQAGSVVDGQYINSLNVSKLVTGTISSKQITLAITGGSGDSYVAAGKTDFTNVQTGFILGLDDSDGDTPKFYIGDATSYLYWDGTDLTYTGHGVWIRYGSVTFAGESGDKTFSALPAHDFWLLVIDIENDLNGANIVYMYVNGQTGANDYTYTDPSSGHTATLANQSYFKLGDLPLIDRVGSGEILIQGKHRNGFKNIINQSFACTSLASETMISGFIDGNAADITSVTLRMSQVATGTVTLFYKDVTY